MGDNEFEASSDDDRVVTEVSMLEENACVLLMNTNSVLDGGALSCSVDESGVLKMC
jgi:hypothetical protein